MMVIFRLDAKDALELEQAPFPKDFCIPVQHKLMIKELLEDENGEIWIIGQ